MWKATYVAHLVQLTVYCEAKKLSDSGVTLYINSHMARPHLLADIKAGRGSPSLGVIMGLAEVKLSLKHSEQTAYSFHCSSNLETSLQVEAVIFQCRIVSSQNY